MKKLSAVFFSLLVMIVTVVTFSQAANALEFGARGYYWIPTFKATMRADTTTTTGTEFDLKDTLGMGNKAFPAIEVFAGLGKNHLSLMYTQANFSGSAVLASPITFFGTTFPAGTAVSSDLKFRMLDLAYKRDLIDLKNILAGFSVGVIGKIKYIEADASILAAAQQQSRTLRVPIPMIGVGASAGILANILEARAEITGIAYSGNSLIEASADLSLTPFPFLDIHGGYRIIDIRVDFNDTLFNSQLAGPYLALTVGF